MTQVQALLRLTFGVSCFALTQHWFLVTELLQTPRSSVHRPRRFQQDTTGRRPTRADPCANHSPCPFACARRRSRIRPCHILFPSSQAAGGRAGPRTTSSHSHTDALGSSASMRAPATPRWRGPLPGNARHVAAGCSSGSQPVSGCAQPGAARLIVPVRAAFAPLRWPCGLAIRGCPAPEPRTPPPSRFWSSSGAHLASRRLEVAWPPARAPARSLPLGQRRRGRSGNAELASRTTIADTAAWGGAAA